MAALADQIMSFKASPGITLTALLAVHAPREAQFVQQDKRTVYRDQSQGSIDRFAKLIYFLRAEALVIFIQDLQHSLAGFG